MENIKPWQNDCLGRKEIADLLTEYIDDAHHVSVVNINSPWGTGKTFFLTNWRDDLKRSRAVVYFNAWENDYTGDPMISLVANIRDQLKEFIPRSAKAKRSFQSVLKAAGSAVVSTTPVILKGVAKKVTGVAVADVLDSMDEVEVETVEGAAEKFVEHLIESNADRLASVKNFKESLGSLIKMATKDNGEPLYIFIDELDRCRPTYAIELLERVKHIFDIIGCKFVVATDTAQLSHSISVVYGDNFSSVEYLKRFFDMTYSFAQPDVESWVKIYINWDVDNRLGYIEEFKRNQYFIGGEARVDPSSGAVIRSDLSHAQLVFYLLYKVFAMDLRKLNRVKDMLELLVARCAKENLHFFYLAYLCFLFHSNEELFNTLEEGHFQIVQGEVKQKFPSSVGLYFGVCNRALHDIAADYMLLGYGDNHELNRRLNSDREPRYLLELARLRDSDRLNLSRYMQLVKLAIKIG